MKKVFFFLCTTWVALFNNSRMNPESPTYDTLCWFRVPRDVRFLEVAILAIAYLNCVQLPRPPLVRTIHVLSALFVGVAIVGLLPGMRIDAERLQEIYIRIVPMLFYFVAATIGVSRRDLQRMSRFYVIITGISIVIALVYQIPYHGDNEDYIHGAFSDAHIFGMLVAVLAVASLSEYIETRRFRYLAGALALLVFSLYPSNGKVVLLSGAWFGLVFLRQYLLPKTWFVRVTVCLVLLIIAVFGARYLASREDSPMRLFELSAFSLADLGPVAAWPIALAWLSTSGFIFIFGMGAGEYGWLAASRAVAAGGGSDAAQSFSFEFSLENLRSAGFLFRTNTWSSLLVEFGIIGFVLFVAALGWIVRGVLRSSAVDGFDRTMMRVFVFALVAIVFQGAFTPFSNWSESILLFPLMYIAAYFTGRKEDDGSAIAMLPGDSEVAHGSSEQAPGLDEVATE